jgi:hypothetical protein
MSFWVVLWLLPREEYFQAPAIPTVRSEEGGNKLDGTLRRRWWIRTERGQRGREGEEEEKGTGRTDPRSSDEGVLVLPIGTSIDTRQSTAYLAALESSTISTKARLTFPKSSTDPEATSERADPFETSPPHRSPAFQRRARDFAHI